MPSYSVNLVAVEGDNELSWRVLNLALLPRLQVMFMSYGRLSGRIYHCILGICTEIKDRLPNFNDLDVETPHEAIHLTDARPNAPGERLSSHGGEVQQETGTPGITKHTGLEIDIKLPNNGLLPPPVIPFVNRLGPSNSTCIQCENMMAQPTGF